MTSRVSLLGPPEFRFLADNHATLDAAARLHYSPDNPDYLELFAYESRDAVELSLRATLLFPFLTV